MFEILVIGILNLFRISNFVHRIYKSIAIYVNEKIFLILSKSIFYYTALASAPAVSEAARKTGMLI